MDVIRCPTAFGQRFAEQPVCSKAQEITDAQTELREHDDSTGSGALIIGKGTVPHDGNCFFQDGIKVFLRNISQFSVFFF